MRFEIFICFVAILFSCSNGNNGITAKAIEEFTGKYENVKFDGLKDIAISIRGGKVGEVVYMVGKGEGNLPVYIVTYNLKKGGIANINKINLEKGQVQDYLTREEIVNAIKTIRKYNFFYLATDSFQNVYINPFYAVEPPYFLRLKTFTGDSIVRKGFVYELYKNKWYLNSTRRRD